MAKTTLAGFYKYTGHEATNIGMGQCGFDEITEDGKEHFIGIAGTNSLTEHYHHPPFIEGDPNYKTWVFIRNVTKPSVSLVHILNEDEGGLGEPVNYHMWVTTDPGDIQIELTSHVGDTVNIWLPQSGVIDGCFASIAVKSTITPTGTETPTVLCYRG